VLCAQNRSHKLKISTAPAKARSREPAYSPALNRNKIERQRVTIQRIRQANSQMAMVDGVWSWDGEGGIMKRMNQD